MKIVPQGGGSGVMISPIDLKKDKYFIQAMKDLQEKGLIKIHKDENNEPDSIELIDVEGLKKYMDNFGVLD